MRLILTIAIFLSTSLCCLCQEDQDAASFCTYQMEQAMAQHDLLRTPNAVGGISQPETGLPMQVVGGVSNSLSGRKKASLTVNVAQKTCDLYKASTKALQQIQYASAAIEKQALTHRLELIDVASHRLDDLIAGNLQRVQSQNMTRSALYILQEDKLRLIGERLNTQTKLSALVVPPLSDTPLKDLVAEKQTVELETQHAIARLNRQSSWDITLAFGAHKQISTTDSPTDEKTFGPYGQVNITYNLGKASIEKHLARAADAYGEWKLHQVGDAFQNARVLKQQIIESLAAQEAALSSLREHEAGMRENLQAAEGIDTSAALEFRNRLLADQVLLDIEISDASFRIDLLKEYLIKNF